MAVDGMTRTCVAGDMQLSVYLNNSLVEAIAQSELEIKGELDDSAKAGNWHCPRCGNRMIGTTDLQKGAYHLEQFCQNCSFVLTTLQIYQLVERHPHT
jgi:predicted RNA-binding Zn-ribbon protein involved in translation (DUF1610 family)